MRVARHRQARSLLGLRAIFEEYHQLDNAARERTRGLGLGLAIVQRLAKLLGHRIHVRSRLGKGSVFAIEVLVPVEGQFPQVPAEVGPPPIGPGHETRKGTILLIEDDPDLRELVGMLLTGEGHQVFLMPDGYSALDRVAGGAINPDLVIADFNLHKGLSGLEVAARLRERLGRPVPVIIMTGDISSATMREIRKQHCVQLNKPVKLTVLMSVIERLLAKPSGAEVRAVPARTIGPAVSLPTAAPDTIHIVDDDANVRDGFRALLEEAGHTVATYPTCEAFLAAYRPQQGGCVLIDAYLPGMSGLELLHRLRDEGDRLPAIMITGNSDVAMAVEAMKVGASDFLEKPTGGAELLASVEQALEQSRDLSKSGAWRESARAHIAGLTPRQRQIMELVLAGHPSKNIAADLGISQRTVENHRAFIMKKTGSKSLPALARLAMAASAKA